MDIEFKGKILVADDEKINVEFFQVMLERLGFEVDVAYNGQEVMRKVKLSTPDIILLDLLMPKMNGVEVTKALKSNPETNNIPIIILTAIDDIKEKVDLFEIGVEDYITKPFNFIEILARIRGILKTRRFKQLATTHKKKVGIFEDYFKRSGKLIENLRSLIENYDANNRSSHIKSKNSSRDIKEFLNELKGIEKKLYELHESLKKDIEVR